MTTTVEAGLWGGTGGTAWNDGPRTGIRSFTISSGSWIDSISVTYTGSNDPVKHGGNGGTPRTPVILDSGAGEVLTGVSGYYGSVPYLGTPVVKSLTFTSTLGTSVRTHGPYGTAEGTPFEVKVDQGTNRIVNFKGRSGSYIDAIGFRISNN